MLSNLLMQILDIRALVIGKLLNGFFVIIVHISVVKMINETVPHHLTEQYGSFIFIFMSFGYMLTFLFGLGFPVGDYDPELPRTGDNLAAY